MKIRHKPISEQVIVITGASSGIGLTTAVAAANRGARVVLASRNEKSLTEAEKRISATGGEAIFVVADVANPADVQKIADAAISAYGGFDTWVNNAGVSVLAKLEEISDEDSRRLFDTNYWGQVYGSKVAVEHLKSKGGAIVNVGSLLSDVSVPLQGQYCASKHAVKGFTDSLRQELQMEKAPISVTLIKPAAIATPFFKHAKNYLSQQAKAPPPVYRPEEVASAILYAASHTIRDIRVGGAGPIMAGIQNIAPALGDLMARGMGHMQLSDRPKKRVKDNLHNSGMDGEMRDASLTGMPSIYTRAITNPLVTAGAVAVMAATAVVVTRRVSPSNVTTAKKIASQLSAYAPNISKEKARSFIADITDTISRNLPSKPQIETPAAVNKLALTGLIASLLKGSIPKSKSALVAKGIMHVVDKKTETAKKKAMKLVA